MNRKRTEGKKRKKRRNKVQEKMQKETGFREELQEIQEMEKAK